MNRPDRRGFGLIELLIVAVLGSVIVTSIYTVLITNTRVLAAHTATTRARETIRSGVDVLFTELREISSVGGDIITMNDDALVVRVMRGFGVVCAVNLIGTPSLTVIRVGDWFESGDSILVFGDNDESRSSDDVWHSGLVSAVDTTGACPIGGPSPAQVLTVPSMGTQLSTDSVRTGAPVRAHERLWFGPTSYGGGWYLGKGTSSSTAAPVVGPLRAPTENGLEFGYLDAFGVATITLTDVSQIEVTLRTPERPVGSQGSSVSDSVSARFYLRN